MGKGKRATPRASANQKLATGSQITATNQNKENLKRISLFFDRLINFNRLSYDQSTWITQLNSQALSGHYFVLLNSQYEIVLEHSPEGVHPGVNWIQLGLDIQTNLDLLNSQVLYFLFCVINDVDIRGLISLNSKRRFRKRLNMKLRDKG
jgi:hypothetical protein